VEAFASICGYVLLAACIVVPLVAVTLEVARRGRLRNEEERERAHRREDAARLAGHVSDEALRRYVDGR
jgi:hypothetical protein